MNAPLAVPRETLFAAAEPIATLEEFAAACRDFAGYWRCGWLEKAAAVDAAQWHAELWGIVAAHGQDLTQRIMAEAFRPDNELLEAPLLAPEPEQFRPREYRPPRATIDAFLYLARLGDTDRLTRWLEQHPRDAASLHEIWKARKCTAPAQ